MKVGIVEAKTKRNQLRNKTFKCIKFDSNFTFLDYDIIIWEAETLAEDLFEKASDKRTYVDDSKIKNKLKIIERRDTEMMHLLELGRTIFIHLPPPQKIYNMEKKEFFDILNCFDTIKLSTSVIEGNRIELRGEEPFISFWEETKELFKYSARLEAPYGKALFFIENTQFVIGAYSQIENGYVVILPSFNHSSESILDDLDDSPSEEMKNREHFVKQIIKLAESLKVSRESEVFKIPSWSKNYILPTESKQKAKLQKLEEELNILQRKINHQAKLIQELEFNKILFAGNEKGLEIQVKKVFEALGFISIEALPNRDDLILKYGDKVAVVEIKSILRKSAAEKNAAQLEKWVSEYYHVNEVKPKGILVANAYSEIPLKDRNASPFPPQMIPYSKVRGHCLMTSLQLLGLYLDCKDDEEKKEKMINLLFATNGELNKYQDWTKFLTIENESTER